MPVAGPDTGVTHVRDTRAIRDVHEMQLKSPERIHWLQHKVFVKAPDSLRFIGVGAPLTVASPSPHAWPSRDTDPVIE
jgi:hypothetical protein